MRKAHFLIFLISFFAFSQKESLPFKEGEFLKFRINYGLLNAGFATLKIDAYSKDQEKLYHVKGKGWTTGMTDFFFPVDDDYQTYFSQGSLRPSHFIRKIDEGGYTKDKEIYFDFDKHQARVIDHKHNSEKLFFIQNDIQDMLSALYYFRRMDLGKLEIDDIISINMFYDNAMKKIKLKFIGRAIVRTKVGKVNTLVFSPLVEIGRIFKDQEGVKLWISDDENKIPVKIKASLMVGSLKAELEEYRGLATPLSIIFN